MAILSQPNFKSVVSATTTSPPGSTNQQDWYLVPTGASGAWASQQNKLTRHNGTSWDFIVPHKDTLIWAADTRKIYIYNSSGSSFDVYTPNTEGGMIVREVDGTPNVSNVTEIRVSNGTLTDNTGGVVTVTTGGGGGGGGGIDTTSDVSANIPAAGNAGYLYFPTDGFSILRDDGTNWQSWGPIFKTKPPVLSSFAWVNQGSATATERLGGIVMTMPTSAGENVRLLKKTLAASSNYTAVCGIIPNIHGTSFKNCGLMVRESSSGKVAAISFAITAATTTPPSIQIYQWTNPTTFSSSAASLTNFVNYGQIFFKIVDNGTNRSYHVSNNNLDYIQVYSATRTTFLTPDEIGIYINQASTDFGNMGAHFFHFEEF